MTSNCDGSCVNLQTDPLNCKSCGNECPAGGENTVATCTAGACGVACAPGFGDCNGDPADGCERDLGSDPSHCRACGHSCQGGTCSDRVCSSLELFATPSDLGLVAIDSRRAFVASEDAIRAVSHDGGKPEVFVPEPGTVHDLTTDGEYLFWIGSNSGWEVHAKALSGGPVATLAQADDEAHGPIPVGDEIVWSDGADGGRILSLPRLGGGEPRVLVTGQRSVHGIAAHAGNLYWTVHPSLGADGGLGPDGVVKTAPLGGAVSPTVLQSGGDPYAIAADATGTYWTDRAGGRIFRLRPGETQPSVIAKDQSEPDRIALDEHHAYWTSGGEIWRLSKCAEQGDAGAVPELVAEGSIAAFAVGATALLFSDDWSDGGDDDSLRRVAK
jgi:hypothetical protein